MSTKINLEDIYAPSEDIVAREIQGELIIIPITSGIGDLEDEVFTLNETGRAIWGKMDGKIKVSEIIRDLSLDFGGEAESIGKDVLGLLGELLKRRIIVELKKEQ